MKPEQVEKCSLGLYPTPLQRLERLEKKLDKGPLFIKREDLSDIGLGGNKIRKLEYFAHDALLTGSTVLLTYGGPQTNHGRLTAAVAARLGMKAVLILDGGEPDYYSGNLVLDRLMGADLRFIGDECLEGLSGSAYQEAYENRVQQLTDQIVQEYQQKGEKVYIIPMGGSNELGALGYIQMIPELLRQIEEQQLKIKTLVCGAGSMGTFAGLWLGAAYYHAPFEVVGVSINPQTVFTAEKVSDYVNRISNQYEMGIVCEPKRLHIEFYQPDAPYAGLGYNIPDEATMNYVRMMAETEAIFLDPCYTGKVFHGFAELLRKGQIPSEGAIFLHTGGTPGIWAKEHMDAMQPMLDSPAGRSGMSALSSRLERLNLDLAKSQQEISEQMENLRQLDKTQTVQFRELMAKKLTNSQMIAMLQAYGLK